MANDFLLYQTLTVNAIPKKDLSVDQKKMMHSTFLSATEDQKENIIKLIYEYAVAEDKFTVWTEDGEVNTPYSISQKENDIEFNLKKIPIPLRWVLFRFTNIITPKV